ncbi:serine dehydratase-like [Ixodes scapularis]
MAASDDQRNRSRGQREEISLYCRTPLIESLTLQGRHLPGVPVYLKLENTQPTGSFKMRGLSRLCQHGVQSGHDTLVTSSGGNAGLAVAHSARRLGVKARVYVPDKTSRAVVGALEQEGANVIATGSVWDDADLAARDYVRIQGGYYCHPFDNPIVWSGHASMIVEAEEDLSRRGVTKPSAVVTCAGGGGLLCGIVEGMHRVGWTDVPVLVMETRGAASFRAARDAGRPVAISAMTSVAVTLGALTVCQRAVDLLHSHPVISELVTDRQAVDACFKFADDHRMLVEPSCGATLAALYSGLAARLYAEGKLSRTGGPLLLIVCGGSAASLGAFQRWREIVDRKVEDE